MVSTVAVARPAQTRRSILDKYGHVTEQGTLDASHPSISFFNPVRPLHSIDHILKQGSSSLCHSLAIVFSRLPNTISVFSALVSFSFSLINRRRLLFCASCSQILSDRLPIYVLIPENTVLLPLRFRPDRLAIYVLVPENMYLKAWPWNLSKVHRSYADLLSWLIIVAVSFVNEGICR